MKPRRIDDPHLESLKQYFHKNFIMSRDRIMDELIKELEAHFTFRLVVHFRELNKRVAPDPYPLPRPFKTVLDFKYGFGAMGYFKDHGKYMAVITSFGVFVPTTQGFGLEAKMVLQR